MQGTPRVLIVGYFGFRNMGDEAILHAMIADFRRLRPGIALKVLSGDPAATSIAHDVPAISWRDNRAVFAAVADSDLIILGGGGIFHDYYGCNPNLFLTDRQTGIVYYAAPAVLGGMLGKPVVLYAAGVGPLFSDHARKLTAIVCEAASAITVRDDESKRVLRSIGVPAESIEVTADPVFGLRRTAGNYSIPRVAEKPRVAVAIRHWDIGVESSFWEAELAEGLDRFIDDHHGSIVFVPLGRLPGLREDDCAVCERVLGRMRHKANAAVISQDIGLMDLIGLFGACDLTIGMRLHSLIFSAMGRVPVVALSYDPKVASLMERIGDKHIIGLGALDGRSLAATMQDALANAAAFREKIPGVLKDFGQLASKNADVALEAMGAARRPGWPSPQLSALLIRSFQTQAENVQSLRSELRDLSNTLAGIEAERDAGRKFLTEENRTIAARADELSSTVNQLRALEGDLRKEIEDLRVFQLSQTRSIANLEGGNQALRDELRNCREQEETRAGLVARAEFERSRLLNDLKSGLQTAQAQIDSAQRALRERDETLAEERRLRESIESRLAESVAFTKSLDTAHQNLLDATARYREDLERELRALKSQRAWKIMLYIRGAYVLLARHGRRGWGRFVRWNLSREYRGMRAGEYDVRLPDIAHYTPDNAFIRADKPELPPAFTEAPAAAKKYDLVILGIIDFDFRFQRPQHIASHFAQTGHRVFWISPTRFLPDDSEQPYRVVPLRENLWEIHLRGRQPDIYMGHLDPPLAKTLAESLGVVFHDWAIAAAVLMLQIPFWRQTALLIREKFGVILAYDCMDDWETFENMGSFNVSEEKPLAAECDLLAVSATGIEEKFRERGLSPLLIRNGVDFDFFHAKRSEDLLAGVPKPVIGYFGAIADWIDLDLVLQVATLRPEYSFVLIGQVFGRDVSALQALPNVHLKGNQAYQSIPAFLEGFDACLIPFLLNQVTKSTDPVKLYEYLSKGKPVIATDMAELAQCGDLIYIGRGPLDFAGKIDSALAENPDQFRSRRIEFARTNTWERRVAALNDAAVGRFPFVSILIVTCNSAEFVATCLDSIRDFTGYPRCEVIVVDNGSTDGTVEILKRRAATDSMIRLELLDRNTGFAAANNAAERVSRGEYLILLNIDTIVTSGWVARLVRHQRQDTSIGVICPVTNFAGNEIKINVSYTSANQMQHFALDVARQNHGKTMDIAVAPLYCALIPRKVWRQVGELDEQFGIGMFEDDDLCLRIRQAGYRVAVAEDCFVHHFGQGSFSKLQPQDYAALFESNRRHFEGKWKTEWKPHQTRSGVRPAFEEKKFTPAEFV